jgi:hypothetical protein
MFRSNLQKFWNCTRTCLDQIIWVFNTCLKVPFILAKWDHGNWNQGLCCWCLGAADGWITTIWQDRCHKVYSTELACKPG